MTDPIQQESIDSIVQQYHSRLKVTDDMDALIQDILNSAYAAGRDRGTLAHPRYTSIDIEGRDGYYTIFSRKQRSEFINVEIVTPEIELESAVPVNDISQQVIGAKHVYRELEGYSPTSAGLDLYMRPFEHLSGNYNRGVNHGQ